jgi:phosphatidylserine/phosphatidylglycerophosphate/cardiolipin synthase-like enzyme
LSWPLLNLCESDLRTLASAIRSGRLVSPFSTFALQRLIGDSVSPAVADWMTATAESGCSSRAMASWLDACADGLCGRTPLEHTVQLVTTAPEGNAAYHRDTAVVVQDLFRRAKKSVLISTYALYGGREIFQTLAERMDEIPELLVRMFVNIDQSAGETSIVVTRFVQQFRERHWPAHCRLPEIYYDVRSTAVLHAKCILIDGEELFVTSANFTDAAQHRNVEVGLVVKSPVIVDQATRFFESLMKSTSYVRAL